MRSRAWCFTINNYTPLEFETLKLLQAQYIILGREIGETLTPHIQGYVYFTNAKTRPAVSRMLPRAHLEKRFGSHTQAADYCKKEGDFWEHGEAPVESTEASQRGGAATKIAWDKILEHVRRGDTEYVAVNYPKIYIQLKPRLESLHAPTVAPMSGELLHEWWVGKSGTGKSRALWELYPAHYEKPLNKWWDGYKHEDTVAIEEWSPQNVCTTSSLKRWADRYPFAGEIKGGVMQRLRPKKIIVLSNFRPDQCFVMAEDLEPILRRFTILEFPKDIQRARFRAAWFTNQPETPITDGVDSTSSSENEFLPDLDNIWN
ncbi:MAG: putative viral replication protein [Cressdnaviricota sp.]|nr:MAG: putative viral replication protein [Cressdnaviricota sp.]